MVRKPSTCKWANNSHLHSNLTSTGSGSAGTGSNACVRGVLWQ
jgi:hypothetical protein